MFVPPVQKMINFGYIKNRTMFLVFNHPVGKQEFDNNIQSIKSALKFYMPSECKECENNLFDDIKAFVTHTPKKKFEEQKETQTCYKERSSGDFEINIKDEKLCKLVHTIQTIIKSRHDT